MTSAIRHILARWTFLSRIGRWGPPLAPLVVTFAMILVLLWLLAPLGTEKDSWVAEFKEAFKARPRPLSADAFASLISAKSLWTVSAFVMITSAGLATIVAFILLSDLAKASAILRRRVVAVFAMVLLAVGVGVGLTKDRPLNHLWPEHLMDSLREAERGYLTYGRASGSFTTVGNISIGIVCIALLGLAGATVFPFPRSAERRVKVAQLSRQAAVLPSVAYLGAMVLVSGTIEVYYLLSLAAKVTSAAEDGMRLARAHSQAIGFMFSAFLGMAYALPWLIIRSRARALFEEDSDRTGPLPGGRRGWMRENGLDISLLREVPSLLAVVAPILSGSLAEVWGSIAKGG